MSGPCVCGCRGRPATRQASIDIHKYQKCPARLRRKERERIEKQKYRDKLRASAETQKAKESARLEKQRQLTLARHAADEAKAEEARHQKGLPALSIAEAKRRGTRTYLGISCSLGHEGERDARNGECIVCRSNDKRIRAAMKRGAHPETLTAAEKAAIALIYQEARRLTQTTGVSHHVDHIKPLARGGRHHPDNLRIITAKENLKKGSKWDGDWDLDNQAPNPSN